MSTQDYQAFKDVVFSRIVKLEEFVKIVESYKLLLEEKTKGYVAAICNQKAPYTHSWFYIVRWFRTFVGIKDEAMLLINGELVRKYHKQQHESYIHNRGKEEKYYKITGLLGLSGCCCDGLNYDLRKISQQHKEFASKRKEEEILNRLSDRVYDAEDRLDGFCKAVDKQVEVFRSELRRKASSHITSITIEYKYKAEHLVVKFDRSSGRTSCIDGVYTCQEARKGSRMHALHSGIEEPPNLTTIQQHQPPATVMPVTGGGGAGFTTAGPETTTAPRPTKHRRMLIEDDEDVSYQHEVARSRAAAEAEVARLAALEAQKAPDFGFHYSIDAEKREFGAAVELLAMPTHADLGQDDDDAMDVTTEGGGGGGERGAPASHMTAGASIERVLTLQPAPLTPAELALRDQTTLKLKVHFPDYQLPTSGLNSGLGAGAGSGSPLVKTRVEGVADMVVYRRNNAQRALSHVHLTVSLAHCSAAFAHSMTLSSVSCKAAAAAALEVSVSVEAVVQEVWWLLWLGGILGSADVLVLPRGLRIGIHEFTAGAWVPLPGAEERSKKRYQVLCEDRPAAIGFLQRVSSSLLLTDARGDGHKQEFVATQQWLLCALCDHIASSTSSAATLLKLRDVVIAPLRADDANNITDIIQHAIKGETGERKSIGISISGTHQWNGVLPVLLQVSTGLHAVSSGITLLDLLACATQCKRFPLSLTSLDLSSNHFLSYCEAPWELLAIPPDLTAFAAPPPQEEPESEPMDLDVVDLRDTHRAPAASRGDPVEVFLTWLLCGCPSLRVLHLSHCATTATQAEELCAALEKGLRARASRGHVPLAVLEVRGLRQLSPVAVEQFLQRVGPYSAKVDVEGYSFAV